MSGDTRWMMTERLAVVPLRIFLVVLFGVLVVFQTLSLPGQFAYMAQESPDLAYLRWPLTALSVFWVLCVQVVIVCRAAPGGDADPPPAGHRTAHRPGSGDLMAIVVRIDVELARRKMSVGEFAERVGLTPANVAVLKNGRAKAVRFSTLEAMCRVLDCQPGDLLEWVEDASLPELDAGAAARR
jgi:putative transcriptional regulator